MFQKTRLLTSTLERPVGTSSTHNKVWHGYAPYNPSMLAKQPLEFEDLVWPGERVPRPKRARRRGKKAIAA